MVQLREKMLPFDEYTALAREIKCVTDEFGVPLIIDDNVEVAIASGADGVHVGQDDMSPSSVRKLIGDSRILGVTARTVEQAVSAEREGADYIGSGAVFSTSTKLDAKALPHDELKRICASVSIPVVAIGGIDKDNILRLSGCGMAGVAVSSSLFASSGIEAAALELRALSQSLLATDCQEG